MIVTGRVQGVFFRGACADEARARGLSGWVKNVPDGRVEAVFEGPDAQVEAMVVWCREGPPSARVDEVESWKEEPSGQEGFRVAG